MASTDVDAGNSYNYRRHSYQWTDSRPRRPVRVMKPVLSTAYAQTETAGQAYKAEGQLHATSKIDAVPGKELPVASSSSVKRFMDYRCITDDSSVQYALLQKGRMDSNGLIYITDHICAALGSKYGPIGTKYIFVLKDGNRTRYVKIIKADQKKDRDTIGGAGWTDKDGNILEMIVDRSRISQECNSAGDMDKCQMTSGRITKIYREN